MVAVVEEVDAAGSPRQQPRHERHVGLLAVALGTGEDQVVGPIVGRLASARPDMVQRDPISLRLYATIGADGAMLFEQPLAMLAVGPATRLAKNCGGRGRMMSVAVGTTVRPA